MNATTTHPTASAAAQTPITGTANNSNHGTKIDLQASYQSLVTGLQTYYQPTDTFLLNAAKALYMVSVVTLPNAANKRSFCAP